MVKKGSCAFMSGDVSNAPNGSSLAYRVSVFVVTLAASAAIRRTRTSGPTAEDTWQHTGHGSLRGEPLRKKPQQKASSHQIDGNLGLTSDGRFPARPPISDRGRLALFAR